MRTLFLSLFIATLGLSCRAAEQLVEVTAARSNGWTITGANGLMPGNPMVLSAGTQLSHKFSESVLVVHLVARPVFSEQAEDLPIVGVGSAAVAFLRQNDAGHLLLVVDQTVTELPWTVPLDSNKDPAGVDVLLAYDGSSGTGLISFQDQVRFFETAPTLSPTDVWVSAGVRSDWPVDLLQVLLPDVTTAGNVYLPSPTSVEKGSQAAAPVSLEQLRMALDQLRSGTKTPSLAASAPSVDQKKKAGPISTLEVFTPPSVRRARVMSVVRDAVSRSRGK